MAHRFRFFVENALASGVSTSLSSADRQHLKVLRADTGTEVEVVDSRGLVFSAHVEGATLAIGECIVAVPEQWPRITLYAGILAPQQWGDLVDGAVQAGVATIVPVAIGDIRKGKFDPASDRFRRVVEASAKQSKRQMLTMIAPTLDLEVLIRDAAALAVNGGIVADENGGDSIFSLGTQLTGPEVSVLVGPAAGLSSETTGRLVDAGWQRATLGPTILRSETAAAVAVSALTQR